MTYGSQIKQAREARRLTQEQLAEHLDVTRQAVSKWEADLSRPTREKLDKPSGLLDIPPETWAKIDAENAPPQADPNAARPWKIAVGVLSILCAALAIALTAALQPEAEKTAEDVPPSVQVTAPYESEPVPEQEPEDVLPEALELTVRRDFEFGNASFNEYDPIEIPGLEDWEQIMQDELWCSWFPDGTRLSLLRSRAQWSDDRDYFNVYLLWAPPAETTGNELEYHILYRIGEDYTGSDFGEWEAEAFSNVLGYDGFKITLSAPDNFYRCSYYIVQLPDGRPYMLTNTGAAGNEADIDDDGSLEIVSFDSYFPGWDIVDTTTGEEGAFVYKLQDPDSFPLLFDPERNGFIYMDGNNTVVSRYVLRDGEMVSVPDTDFSVADYPDVAGTKITFVTDYEQSQTLSDELDPDVILPYNPGVRITHRQQAYLALQELYNMTGIKLDACYCAASEFSVCLSLLPDGFNQRDFFHVSFGENYGGIGIPSFYISWKELGNDWSPLSFADAVQPEGESTNDHIRWYYERMKAFNTGEIEEMFCLALEPGMEQYGYIGDGSFTLTDGSAFRVNYQERDGKTVLVDLYGPYPDGHTEN